MAGKTNKKRKKTKYQSFVSAAKSYNCGKTKTKETLTKRKKAYEKDAKAKGKTAAEIKKTVTRVLKTPCSKK